jgi:DDE superfamily endonuclease
VDHQPRLAVCRKKRRRDRLIRLAQAHPDWVLGFEDEVWWSRVRQPHVSAWTPTGQPLRLVEQSVATDDPQPKALACYGLLLRQAAAAPDQLWLRFVEGRPVSALTTQFLDWCCLRLAAMGKTALLLVWDNASWHLSKAVRAWIRQHNLRVKQARRGARILVCFLPSKSPWLNPIEPKWTHGKRKVLAPDRLLDAQELEARVYDYYACTHEPHLAIAEEVA